MNCNMTRKKKIISGLVIVFVIAQFFQPNKNQGNLEPIALFLVETQAPNEVKQILKHACFDCHSSVYKLSVVQFHHAR